MTGAFRTPAGGRIDRGKSLRFTFDGKVYAGLRGDTLASALLGNGVHLVGRSFKYHRPRGIVAAGADEPNALVEVVRGQGRRTPNLRATQIELYEGLIAFSQNRWPSLRHDVGAVNNALSPLFAAGFYYKTFMGPTRGAWKRLYEPAIRRAAGLGAAPKEPDPDRYAQLYAHCDVLIAGGGPAGLAAALGAAESGASVILCDEAAEIGGSLLDESSAAIDGRPAREWAIDLVMALAMNERVHILPRTTAFGYYADNFIALAERVTDHLAEPTAQLPRERLWQVRAKEVVLATGAIERPLVFPGNDRPGVMLAGAARTYLNRYGVKCGARAVVATACDSAYQTALDLKRAGVEVALIADLRAEPGAAASAAAGAGIRVLASAAIMDTSGRHRIAGVSIGQVGAGATVATVSHDCDVLLVSGGWTPTVHLFSQSRGKLRFDEHLQAFVPGVSAQRERSAGACNGTFELAAVLDEGYACGAAAAQAAGFGSVAARTFSATAPSMSGGASASRAMPNAKGKAFIDFQNDVTVNDIRLAVREGFRSIEHVKRYTTTGMATDQGKTSNMNALAVAAGTLGKPIPQVGLTTFRPPYTPVTFGTLAGTSRGDLFDPVRRTATDAWAREHGAVFEDVGQWKRARYFPLPGEDMHQSVNRECRVTRQSAGIFDASTLGKIEIVGPDAAEFMNRLYTNAWTKLGVGRCRYGLMLNEAGFVMDDGVVGRLAPDRFHVTTTTGGAAHVLAHMEDYLQTEFADLKVWLTSITEQWTVIAVQGPRARELLMPLVEGIDLSREALPHMSVRDGSICGVPTRLFRVSFTGELGFEVNVPADYGLAVWEAIWTEARRFDAVAYGTEAMHVMRAEKGYIIIGQETDGTV
ncbi:MAG: sarcosine oxidase subunit alpha family protein, partial [Methylobacteriaceae bacterium]|nr:sarcosine oxidase subunit alpha family protein [Methylobacteriaceae bacterium]